MPDEMHRGTSISRRDPVPGGCADSRIVALSLVLSSLPMIRVRPAAGLRSLPLSALRLCADRSAPAQACKPTGNWSLSEEKLSVPTSAGGADLRTSAGAGVWASNGHGFLSTPPRGIAARAISEFEIRNEERERWRGMRHFDLGIVRHARAVQLHLTILPGSLPCHFPRTTHRVQSPKPSRVSTPNLTPLIKDTTRGRSVDFSVETLSPNPLKRSNITLSPTLEYRIGPFSVPGFGPGKPRLESRFRPHSR